MAVSVQSKAVGTGIIAPSSGMTSRLESSTVYRLFSSSRNERSVSGASWCSSGATRLTEQTQLLKKLRREQSSGFYLIRTLARSFGPYFLTGTLCLLFHDAFMFAIPQVLRAVCVCVCVLQFICLFD